jgi:glucose-1-phosphate cytidylyltransferase
LHEIEFHDAHLETSWKVTVADTGDETQTAGRLKRIQRFIDDDTFMVTYGDGLADINIADLLAFHQQHDKLATVTTVQPPSRFGLLDVGDSGSVDEFAEKAAVHGWINGGYFVFDYKAFDYFPDDAMLEQEPLLNLTKDEQLMAWRHTGFWQPMDTYRETTMLNEMWAEGNAPWKVWSDIDLAAAERNTEKSAV